MVAQFLFDSAFANGAYSHSFGFESFIAWGEVNNPSSYQAWLKSYMLNVFANCDGAVYAIAHEFKDKKLSLLKLAKAANLSIASAESRNAAISMARATLKNTQFLHDELASWYLNICNNEEYAHPAIAFAILSKDDLLEHYAYSTIKTLTINATRAIPLSYKKSSELLYENINLAKEAAIASRDCAKPVIDQGYFSLDNQSDDLFSAHHELDIAMFAHEKLDFRLFMS